VGRLPEPRSAPPARSDATRHQAICRGARNASFCDAPSSLRSLTGETVPGQRKNKNPKQLRPLTDGGSRASAATRSKGRIQVATATDASVLEMSFAVPWHVR